MNASDTRNVLAEAIDFDYLLEVSGDDEELAGELIADFVELFPAQLEQVEAAAATGDAEATRAAAHRLKGSCLAVGANGLAELLRRAEEAAREGSTTPVSDLCHRARGEFGLLKGAAEEFRGMPGQRAYRYPNNSRR